MLVNHDLSRLNGRRGNTAQLCGREYFASRIRTLAPNLAVDQLPELHEVGTFLTIAILAS